MSKVDLIKLAADYTAEHVGESCVTSLFLDLLDSAKDTSVLRFIKGEGIKVVEEKKLTEAYTPKERTDYYRALKTYIGCDSGVFLENCDDDGRKLLKICEANIIPLMLMVWENDTRALKAIDDVYGDGSRGITIATKCLRDQEVIRLFDRDNALSRHDFLMDALQRSKVWDRSEIIKIIKYYENKPIIKWRDGFIKYGIDGLIYNSVKNDMKNYGGTKKIVERTISTEALGTDETLKIRTIDEWADPLAGKPFDEFEIEQFFIFVCNQIKASKAETLIIRSRYDGMKFEEIVNELNYKGLKNKKGDLWTLENVKKTYQRVLKRIGKTGIKKYFK